MTENSEWFGRMLDYWDTTAPLVPIEDAWHGTGQAHDTPARVARDVRLRTLAAQQVAESRAERGAAP
jgi:hypothetical protein